jgi:hypothetical protein
MQYSRPLFLINLCISATSFDTDALAVPIFNIQQSGISATLGIKCTGTIQKSAMHCSGVRVALMLGDDIANPLAVTWKGLTNGWRTTRALDKWLETLTESIAFVLEAENFVGMLQQQGARRKASCTKKVDDVGSHVHNTWPVSFAARVTPTIGKAINLHTGRLRPQPFNREPRCEAFGNTPLRPPHLSGQQTIGQISCLMHLQSTKLKQPQEVFGMSDLNCSPSL